MVYRKSPINIVILGLGNAGKTTLLNRVVGKESQKTLTTIGMNVETIEKEGLLFQAIDLGGQLHFRETLWSHYSTLAKAIIFVFDITDRKKIHEAKVWFETVSRWISENAVLCFFANKIDLRDETENHLTMESIIKVFELDKVSVFPNRSFRIFETSAKTGENVDNSMNWLFSKLSETIRKEAQVSFIYIFDRNDKIVYKSSLMEDTDDIEKLLLLEISHLKGLKTSFTKVSTERFSAQVMVTDSFSLSIGSENKVSDTDLFTASVSLSELLINEFYPIENHVDQLEIIVNTALIQNLRYKKGEKL